MTVNGTVFEFLHVTVSDDRKLLTEEGQRRTVRSQAMRDFKRRQREQPSCRTKSICVSKIAGSPKEMLVIPGTRPRRKSTTSRRGSKSAATITEHSDYDEMRDSQSYPNREVLKLDHFDLSSLPPVELMSIDSKNIYSMALVAAIVDDCFRTCDSDGFAKLGDIMESWTAPHTMALQAANEAFALMCLGGHVGDERIILESRKRHLVATMCLRQELSRPDFDFDSVMGTAQLTLAWSAHGAHAEEGIPWTEHVTGLTAIMAANTRRTKTAPIHGFLMTQYRHFSLMKALICRQRLPFEPRTLYLGDGMPQRGSFEALMRIILGLPLLLEIAYSSTASSSGNQESKRTSRVANRLARIERDLDDWLNDHYLTKAGYAPAKPFRQEEEAMNLGIDCEHDGPSDVRYQFESSLSVLYDAFCWTCRLLIRQAQLDLIECDQEHEAKDHQRMVQEADDCANNLAKTIPLVRDMASGQTGKALCIRGVFHFLIDWYERSGNERSGNEQMLHHCRREEQRFREENQFMQWDALLPYSYGLLYWLS